MGARRTGKCARGERSAPGCTELALELRAELHAVGHGRGTNAWGRLLPGGRVRLRDRGCRAVPTGDRNDPMPAVSTLHQLYPVGRFRRSPLSRPADLVASSEMYGGIVQPPRRRRCCSVAICGRSAMRYGAGRGHDCRGDARSPQKTTRAGFGDAHPRLFVWAIPLREPRVEAVPDGSSLTRQRTRSMCSLASPMHLMPWMVGLRVVADVSQPCVSYVGTAGQGRERQTVAGSATVSRVLRTWKAEGERRVCGDQPHRGRTDGSDPPPAILHCS
jgi:hypothetical protein